MGRLIESEACARGHELALFPPEVWEADPELVETALMGCRGVIVALGPSVQDPSALVQVVTRALERAGVKRVVLLSALGAGDGRRHAGPILNSKIVRPFRGTWISACESAEGVVRASQLEWTIVRALTLTDGRIRRRYRVARDRPSWRLLPTVGRIQVADFVIRALAENRHVREAVTLTR